MIDFKVNPIFENRSYINGIDEAFLPIFISKTLQTYKKLFLVLKNDKQLNAVENLISISNPKCKILSFPAWDTSPYDKSSPNVTLSGQRISTLTVLTKNDFSNEELIVLTTFNGIFIKTAPLLFYKNLQINIAVSQTISVLKLRDQIFNMGYSKVNTVRENNEFSIRGDIVDIFNSLFVNYPLLSHYQSRLFYFCLILNNNNYGSFD